MNITKKELSKLSVSLDRSKRTSKNLLNMLNEMTEKDFENTIHMIKTEIYDRPFYNHKIMEAGTVAINMTVRFKDKLSDDGIEICNKYFRDDNLNDFRPNGKKLSEY